MVKRIRAVNLPASAVHDDTTRARAVNPPACAAHDVTARARALKPPTRAHRTPNPTIIVDPFPQLWKLLDTFP